MTWAIWTAYVATVLVLMSTPGPSQLLMLSNSARYGFARSTATAAGDLSANALQMLAAGFGLAAILATSAHALTIIKWLGVAYLVWLGGKMIWNAKSDTLNGFGDALSSSLKALWLQGFLTSAGNPKAVVFFAALFPQFVTPDQPFAPQFAILSITYIVLDAMFLSAYGFGAGWITKRFSGQSRLWVERIGGSCIIGAALLLSLKTVDET